MAEFKLTISDPKTGKTAQKEVKEADAQPFIGLNVGETVNGESFGVAGFEFKITGGSDACGFPMRRGIKGARKKLVTFGGVGFRKRQDKGIKVKKTVCGHKITDNMRQINLMVTKGDNIMNSIGAKEEKKESEAKPDAKEAPKEAAKPKEKKEAPKEEKKEAPKEEAKPEEKK